MSRNLQRVSVWLAGLAICALSAHAGPGVPKPLPPFKPIPVKPVPINPPPVKPFLGLTVGGARAVPDHTRFTYTTNCPVAAAWTVGAPGTPAAGNGQNLTIAWGAGPAQTAIDVVCNKVKQHVPVEVVNVTLGTATVVLGGNVTVRDQGALRLADTGVPRPAITFTVPLTVNGPAIGAHWHGRIVAGYVQRLMAADSAQWVAKYSFGKPPKIQQSSRNANTSVSPPPRPDCVGPAQTCPGWYAPGNPITYTPQANGPGSIAMRDSPTPGWWLKDQKIKGLDLREAHALWQFETYVCVQSTDAPDQFFRRAVATWQLDVILDSKTHATLKVSPNPVQLVADISDDPAKCLPPPGVGVNFWLNNVVTFR